MASSSQRLPLSEDQRTRLIGEIANVLSHSELPADARQAGLTLIGWLARRMPQDAGSSGSSPR